MSMLLKGGRVYTAGIFVQRDLLIDKGIIVFLSEHIETSPSLPVLDCGGKFIFPGLADVHVHLREPGFSYKETVRTGATAAAHGGFTAVCAMPNLTPPPDSAPRLRAMALHAADAPVRVFSYGSITVGRKGEAVAPLAENAPFAVAFSDDGSGIQDEKVMEQAMREAKAAGRVLAAHCEDNTLVRGGCIHDGEFARAHGLPGICSASEYAQIERDLALAKKTGAAYHICHISTAESVALIRKAKREGVDVTCETAPHYLYFCDAMLEDDGRFKMNPPLRDNADREALLEGLADGTIDMIATDHAPHSAEEKGRGLEKSAMGIVGLETAFPLLYTYLVKPGVISMERLMELLHDAPCRRFNIPTDTGFTVFDLNDSYRVDPTDFLSMGKATPFTGWEVQGRCLLTATGETAVWYDKNRLLKGE